MLGECRTCPKSFLMWCFNCKLKEVIFKELWMSFHCGWVNVDEFSFILGPLLLCFKNTKNKNDGCSYKLLYANECLQEGWYERFRGGGRWTGVVLKMLPCLLPYIFILKYKTEDKILSYIVVESQFLKWFETTCIANDILSLEWQNWLCEIVTLEFYSNFLTLSFWLLVYIWAMWQKFAMSLTTIQS